MKKVLIACLLLAFTSCVKEGAQVEIVNSVSDYRVEKLFEVDGVSVYRLRMGRVTCTLLTEREKYIEEK